MKRIKNSASFWFTGVIILSVGLIVLGINTSQSKVVAETSREVALTCTTDMATKYHIHPVLTIVISGVKQIIPGEIGIKPTCMTSIHTHDDSGQLHIEASVKKDFTLGDFFAVWGKTFNKDQILDSGSNQKSLITVTVNGKVVDTYENTVLQDKDQINITYVTK